MRLSITLLYSYPDCGRFMYSVRANYNDLKNGIHETTEFLEVFLRNLLLNKNHPLHNRTLHISGTFNEIKKPDIETAKPDIDTLKADIENGFQPKTASHILKLREALPAAGGLRRCGTFFQTNTGIISDTKKGSRSW